MTNQTGEMTSPADEKALELMRLLETHCGIYDLTIDGVPIWWFIRGRFHGWAAAYLDEAHVSREPSNDRLSGLCARISSSLALGHAFLLRCLVGMIRTLKIKSEHTKTKPILFFTS